MQLEETTVDPAFETEQRHTSLGASWKWGVAALLFVGVLAWAIKPDGFIVEDSYFYLVIARNIALHGEQSFNLVFPTNGFHPLWLYLLAGYAKAIAYIQPSALYEAAFAVPLSGAILCVGIVALWRVAQRLALNPVLVVVPLAVFLSTFGVLYSEAHVLFACLSSLLWFALSERASRRRGWIGIGILSALVFLARLDTVFFLVPFYVWLLRRHPPQYVFYAGLLASLLVTPYLICNFVYFGGLTPVSGFVKSTFPLVFPKGLRFRSSPMSVTLMGIQVWVGWLPLLFACVVVVLRRARLGAHSRSMVVAVLVGVIFHFAYVALFTWNATGWYWYYIISVMLGCLALAILVAGSRWESFCAAAACISGFVVVLSTMYVRPADSGAWSSRRTVEYFRSNGIENATILASEFPGRIAFHTGNRIIAADFLTGSRNLYNSLLSADDAFSILRSLAAAKGLPIEYVVYNGGKWLEPVDAERQVLVFRDPRMTSVRTEPIGTWRVGRPVFRERHFTVWEVSVQRTPGQGTARE